MRKFRGLTLDRKQWVYGYYCQVGGKSFIILDTAETNAYQEYGRATDIGIYGFIEVIPESVGQFTGLHDKNGKEIYEWDIVQGVFVWGATGGVIEYDIQGASFGFKDGGSWMNWADHDSTNYEVIGNIHENPELLEEK